MTNMMFEIRDNAWKNNVSSEGQSNDRDCSNKETGLSHQIISDCCMRCNVPYQDNKTDEKKAH